MRPRRFLAAAISCVIFATSQAASDSPSAGEIGTVASVNGTEAISFVPWGKTTPEARKVTFKADTTVVVAGAPGKVADLKPGMWIKLDGSGDGGQAKRVLAGQFIEEDGDWLVIFKSLPGEFLQRDVKDWYTNEAGGVKFKVQLMRNNGEITGANLRPASYKEPANGFVFYLPTTLKGAVPNYHGAKAGMSVPDAEGKIVITKDSVTESYWKHPKNPNKPDLGSVSGLTELTIRKLPRVNP